LVSDIAMARVVVPQNYVIAYKWFTLAVASGNQVDGRNFLKPKMTPKEIAEGSKEADAWTRDHTAQAHPRRD